MYSTFSLEILKNDNSLEFVFEFTYKLFDDGNVLDVPCLITNQHVMNNAKTIKFIFHEGKDDT
jgi:hypothetical protein